MSNSRREWELEEQYGTVDTSINNKAVDSNVVNNHSYRDSDSGKVSIGNMPEIPASNIFLGPNGYYNIPRGSHTGNGTVQLGPLRDYTPGDATAEDIIKNKIAYVNGVRIVGLLEKRRATTEGTAVSSDILTGKTAWVNDVLVTGSMITHSTVEIVLNAGEEYIIPLGYQFGSGKVRVLGLDKMTLGNATENDILTGKTAWVNGVLVQGIASPLEEQVKDATATRFNILEGTTAYTKEGKVEGLMPNNSMFGDVVLEAGESNQIPEGYYNGLTNIRALSLTEQTPADALSTDIRTGKTAWVEGALITGEWMGDIDTEGTATAEDIAINKTAWVNGVKITGIASNDVIGFGRTVSTLDKLVGINIPTINWGSIYLINVLIFDLNNVLLYNFLYNDMKIKSGSNTLETNPEDNTKLLEINTNLGSDEILFSTDLDDVRMYIIISGYTIVHEEG